MRLFNPTPVLVPAKCHGINYFMQSNQKVDVSQEVGEWILERFAKYGLVDITIKNSDSVKTFIPMKILEGLNSCLNWLHEALQAYIDYDTETKSINQYGTVLKHKNVRQISEMIEHVTAMIRQTETDHGVSIQRAALEEKTQSLKSRIESLISESESDIDNMQKARERDLELDGLVANYLPQTNSRPDFFQTI